MRGFIYYLPGHCNMAIDNAVCEAYGGAALRSVLRGLKPAMTVGQGPDGTQGLLVTHPDVEAETRRCELPAQEWRQAPGARYWVGMWRSARPTAAELLRPGDEIVDGRPVDLGGEAWLVPVARRWTLHEDAPRWYPALETSVSLDANGELVTGNVVPRLAELWEDAQSVAETIFNAENAGGAVQLDGKEQFARCVRVLATNYRLGLAECGLLELLTTRNMAEVLRVLVDLPGLQALTDALVKKNEAVTEAAG